MSIPYSSERLPMLSVSLIVELLRARPTFMAAFAIVAQALLWTLVPTLFYSAPPGDLPLVLAIGNEWMIGSPYGPPLAYWVAEIAFRLAGNHPFGVYLLSQLCVAATFASMFWLGRRIVGTAHAAMAILLMGGITAFTVPTIEFGANVLAMPLSALSLLFLWQGLNEDRALGWIGLGLAAGLLALTTHAGLVLIALMMLFITIAPQGRLRLGAYGPWSAALLVVLINLPQLFWLERGGVEPLSLLRSLSLPRLESEQFMAWLRLMVLLAFAHAGLLVLTAVAGGALAGPRALAPAFERRPLEPLARSFVYFFALMPVLAGTFLAVVAGRSTPIGGAGPLVVLSGLAVIVAAGDVIRLHRQRVSPLVWLALLLAPPAIIVTATVTLPWTVAVDLEVGKPASAMGQFFTETFRRRTGKPLGIVAGDVRTAGLVALASPDRPSLYIDGSSALSPWVSDEEVRQKGAVVVWAVVDAAATPPAALRERFPDMAPEVPRSFVRPLQGRLALLRIGWAMIRPADQTIIEPAPPQPSQ